MATDKEKVVERLIGEIKDREVLGIRREGPEHTWFHLIVDGKEDITVSDRNCTWEIKENADKVTVDIKEIQTQYCNKENKVIIKGTRPQLECLLYNIGTGLTDERIMPYWKKEKDGFGID